jgi:hypothetical protein
MPVSAAKKIEQLKRKLTAIGPVHPGRITKQYNVCGTPRCRCKAPKNPQKHGPYHYLSFTFQGRGKTVFVPKEQVAEMTKRTERFLRLKELFEQLIETNIELARTEVLKRGT